MILLSPLKLHKIYSARAWFRDLNFDSTLDDNDEEIEEEWDEAWDAGLRYTLVEEAEISKQLRTLQRVTKQFHDEHHHTHDDSDSSSSSNNKGGNSQKIDDDSMDAEAFVKHTIANVQEFAGIGASSKSSEPVEAATEPGKVKAVNVEIVDTVTGEKQEAHHSEDQLKKLQEEYLKKMEAGETAVDDMPDASKGVSWDDFAKKHMPKGKSVTFPLTNINGVGSIWIDDRKQLDKLEPYEQWDMTARVGETLNVRDPNDESIILEEWTIVKGQRQIVYSVPK